MQIFFHTKLHQNLKYAFLLLSSIYTVAKQTGRDERKDHKIDFITFYTIYFQRKCRLHFSCCCFPTNFMQLDAKYLLSEKMQEACLFFIAISSDFCTCKNDDFQMKTCTHFIIFVLILLSGCLFWGSKIDCGYLLEPPQASWIIKNWIKKRETFWPA